MTTNLDKAIAAIDILGDEARTPNDRYETAMKLLDGLELTSLAEDARQRVEAEGLRCNDIFAQNPIASFGESDPISDTDARQMVSHLLDMAKAVRDAAIEAIMARLRHHEGKLPVSEIETARRHRGLLTPILLQDLRDNVQWLREHPEAAARVEDSSSVPFFTFMLMFEWDVADAVPLILESLHLPDEAPFELYGDLVHEYVHRFLAHFLTEEPDRIEALIGDSKANLYVRWAASNAFEYLVCDEKMTAADAIGRLTKLFYDCRVFGDDGRPGMGHPYELSAGILESIGRLGGASEENVPNTDRLWDFVDESITRRKVYYLVTSEKHQLRQPTKIEDCIGELEHWGTFNRPPVVCEPSPIPKDKGRPSSFILPQTQSVSVAPTQRISSERTGRNEPCPCGSGKKYKKCCMRSNNS